MNASAFLEEDQERAWRRQVAEELRKRFCVNDSAKPGGKKAGHRISRHTTREEGEFEMGNNGHPIDTAQPPATTAPGPARDEPVPAADSAVDMKQPETAEPKASLGQRLAEKRQNTILLEKTIAKFSEADEEATSGNLAMSLKTVVAGDKLWKRERPDISEAGLLAMSLDEWLAPIRQWAREGKLGAEEVVELFDEILGKNTLLRTELETAIFGIERPCRQISDMGQLKVLLDKLSEEGLVQRIENAPQALVQRIVNPHPKAPKREGVVFGSSQGPIVFSPLPHKSQLGWKYVEEALARAKETSAKRQACFEALAKEATKGLTPFGVSAGREGYLFVALRAWHRGVLIEVKRQNDWMMARVVKTANIRIATPSPWVRWEAEKGFVPLRGANWPTTEISEALVAWDNKTRQYREAHIQEEARAREETQSFLGPINSIATLPLAFKERALTQLLVDRKTGIVAIFHPSFEWGRYERQRARFGIAIGRKEGEEEIRLYAVVSDFEQPFLQELIGKAMPLVVYADKEKGGVLRACFEQLPQMDPGMYIAHKMVEKAVRMRFDAEQRMEAEEKEPAPEASPAQV